MKKIIFWLPPAGWMGVIFYLSGRTGARLKDMFPFWNDLNWGHFIAYFILAALFYYALASTTSLKNIPLTTVCLCLLYGITDEYHQSLVPSRHMEFSDLLNDMAGAALAVYIISYIIKIKSAKK